MFPSNPMKSQVPESPMEEAAEPSVGGASCPYCGKDIHLSKAPGASSSPKMQGPKSNAAKMPMDQLKNVIKSGASQ